MDIEQRALELVNEVRRENGEVSFARYDGWRTYACGNEALCRAIEAHDAFRQEVSDRDERLGEVLCALSARLRLSGFLDDTANHDAYEAVVAAFGKPFIQPKTDPLVEAVKALQDGRSGSDPESYAACLRAALKSRGLEIREVGE